ncbi:uncharacterized protein LOC132637704 [Lycium barbarum]|uniref:uncharacterized protein LOC132637704 n=1 Tax=Lycium barbarum TaxID=112863 RepID=UPI00293F1C56|nr:uncharacterized protein LOC132637704 [Lycium barbarum]
MSSTSQEVVVEKGEHDKWKEDKTEEEGTEEKSSNISPINHAKEPGRTVPKTQTSNPPQEIRDEDLKEDCLMFKLTRCQEKQISLLDRQVLTLVYASCDAGERRMLWDSISQVSNPFDLPWLVGGDFNVISSEEEKLGGLPVLYNEVATFNHCLSSYGLQDLGYVGSTYTWWNGRAEEARIFKRLDRMVIHLIKKGSDHSSLELECSTTAEEIIKQHWRIDFEGNPCTKFHHKLKKVKNALRSWSKNTYGNIFQQIASLEEFEEDRIPSKFGLLKHIPTLVTKDHNHKIEMLPTEEEVKDAVFALNGESACGPDGFTGSFFQSCWKIVKLDVVDMVKESFVGQELPRFITQTNMFLIPKKEQVQSFSDLRPISLSNFTNKFISRVLHERLVKLLPGLISENRSAFVKGRSIMDNVLLTQEIVREINKRTKTANVVVKLDMTKAYDKVS